MDENRGRSIVLFLLMGVGFFATIIYAFVIAPNNNKSTLGKSDVFLEFPLQKRNLRYTGEGIIPFCKDDNTALTFEVGEDTTVYSSATGIVNSVDDNVISIEIEPNVYIEHYPISNYSVFLGEYVTKGDALGRVSGMYFNLRINNSRSKLYECPYNFLNAFGKSMVEEILEIMEYNNKGCECAILNY
jgi:hypothetical protein